MKKRKIHPQTGFTLLELLVVIAVIGVLASLAVSRYQTHIISANRQAAVATLQLAQQSMERGFLRSSSYVNAMDNAQLAAITAMMPASHTFAQSGVAQNAYTLTATPTATNPDALCGVLRIDQTGLRSVGSGTVDECWRN